MKAGTGGVPETDHEREAIAACAPDLDTLGSGSAKLQWHGNDLPVAIRFDEANV